MQHHKRSRKELNPLHTLKATSGRRFHLYPGQQNCDVTIVADPRPPQRTSLQIRNQLNEQELSRLHRQPHAEIPEDQGPSMLPPALFPGFWRRPVLGATTSGPEGPRSDLLGSYRWKGGSGSRLTHRGPGTRAVASSPRTAATGALTGCLRLVGPQPWR